MGAQVISLRTHEFCPPGSIHSLLAVKRRDDGSDVLLVTGVEKYSSGAHIYFAYTIAETEQIDRYVAKNRCTKAQHNTTESIAS